MEVICHYPGGPARRLDELDDRTRSQALAHCARGELCCLPDGSIAEPVEVYELEAAAHAERDRRMTRQPGKDFRVVLNTPIGVRS